MTVSKLLIVAMLGIESTDIIRSFCKVLDDVGFIIDIGNLISLYLTPAA
jgi:hypothetical protein